MSLVFDTTPGEIVAQPNEAADRGHGERAFYFTDPSGHWLEA